MTSSMLGIRVEANLRLGERRLRLAGVRVSVNGIEVIDELAGLPEMSIGAPARLEIPRLAVPSCLWEVPGHLVSERTAQGASMGFEFDWTEAAARRTRLLELLRAEGEIVGVERRKYPRFAEESDDPPLSAFPVAALARLAEDSVLSPEASPGTGDARAAVETCAVRIENISAGGVKISGRGSFASALQPGDGLYLAVDPPHGQGFRIELLGAVRRVREFSAKDGGPAFTVGLRLEWLDEDQRALYLALIEAIRTSRRS